MQLLEKSLIVPSPIILDSSKSYNLSMGAANKGRSPQQAIGKRSLIELPDIHQPKFLQNSVVLRKVADQEYRN